MTDTGVIKKIWFNDKNTVVEINDLRISFWPDKVNGFDEGDEVEIQYIQKGQYLNGTAMIHTMEIPVVSQPPDPSQPSPNFKEHTVEMDLKGHKDWVDKNVPDERRYRNLQTPEPTKPVTKDIHIAALGCMHYAAIKTQQSQEDWEPHAERMFNWYLAKTT